MINIAICDDNMEEISNMVALIENYRTTNHVQYEYTIFHKGFDLMSVLEKGHNFDIYCLDIIMAGFNGIALAKEIRGIDKTAQIIFFTSSPEFALESYSVNAINYVLKPVTKEKLFYTLNDVFERIEIKPSPSIIVKSTSGIRKILLSNLVYIEAMGKKVAYRLTFGDSIKCTEQFSVACDNLKTDGCFISPHRSYLVNMNYIDNISNTEITLQSGTTIPIAQGKSKEIKSSYFTFQMEQI